MVADFSIKSEEVERERDKDFFLDNFFTTTVVVECFPAIAQSVERMRNTVPLVEQDPLISC